MVRVLLNMLNYFDEYRKEVNMSIKRKTLGICPKCGAELELEIWDSVDGVFHPKEKEKIMKNELFKKKCEKCGSEISLEYPCRFEDRDMHIMIYLIPKHTEEHLNELNEDLSLIEQPNMMEPTKYRVVDTSDELIEKIVIFGNHKQDRPIELCKKKALKEACKDNGNLSPKAILYNHDKSGEYFLFVGCEDEDGNTLTVPFDSEVYKGFDFELVNRNAYKEGKYEVIDSQWANSLMK